MYFSLENYFSFPEQDNRQGEKEEKDQLIKTHL